MKNFKIAIIIACLFIACFNVHSQECGTQASAPPSWFFNPSLRSSQSTPSSYTLRIFVHIIRNSNGEPGTPSTAVHTITSKLNSDFASAGIQFQLVGYDYIDSDSYYINLLENEYASLVSTNAHTDAIDIYVLGQYTETGSTTGASGTIPSTSLWVRGDHYGTSTLTHEMGHCLGLYHTHHGTLSEGGYNESGQCQELVDGSNAATCGDFIVDTPADPCFWDGCTYTGNIWGRHDINQQPYNPNPSNYMAYSDYTCWTNFTAQQKLRMREVITNTPALQSVIGSVLANSPYNITGPTQIRGCNQVEYMVVISNTGTPWTWTCSSNLTFIGGYSSTGIFKIAICPSYGATYSAGWVAVHLNGVEVARKIVGVGDVDIVAVSAFPNPASDLLNIEIEAPIAIASPLSIQQQAPPAGLNFSPPILQQPVYEVKIFNSTTGSLVYENFLSSTSFQIDVSSLPNGVYILQVYDGSDTPPQTQNIVVSH